MDLACPNDSEIRDALARLSASDELRASPQIVRFLTYVVEETLAGRGERIKAYSVATEALGRPADFDPQTDTIVRVEANRLRRALTDYYAGAGSGDPVVILLPSGRYRPVFARADGDSPAPRTPPVPTEPRQLAISAATVVIAAVLIAAGTGDRFAPERIGGASPIPIPTVYAEPFSARGPAATAMASALRGSLQNALARFDEIRVLAGDGEEVSRSRLIDYRLSATLDDTAAQGPRIDFRLTDASDHSVLWTKRFEPRADHTAIVREVATGLADLYSVIGARERAKATFGTLDRRYQCLLDTVAYFRSYNAADHVRVRTCLEATTRSSPSSLRPFVLLSRVYLREYYFGDRSRADNARLLDLSYQAARAAVALRPQSARAYQALMDVQFVRRELAEALAAGDEARRLNPYDTVILAGYGARLLAMGYTTAGLALMREATLLRETRPSWLDFFFVVGALMEGDDDTANRVANKVMDDAYPLTWLCRVVLATKAGDTAGARRAMEWLDATFPSFRANARGELEKIFPAKEIVDRLMAGLAPAMAPAQY